MPDSKHAIQNNFWDNYEPIPESGCWIWTISQCSKGYGQVWYNGKLIRAYQLSWILSNGPIPKGLCVCHSCDTPLCINPRHLFLGTRADNQRDMCNKGRLINLKGSAHGMALLTESQVIDIRASDESYLTLSKKYGVGKSAIASIKTRKNWKHLS